MPEPRPTNPMRIVDSHVHFYSEEVSADPVKWGTERGEPWWVSCVAPVGRRSIQGWATSAVLLRDMDRAGIEKCVLLGWYWENLETCDLQNRWFRDLLTEHPDRLLAFVAVQPRAKQAALDSLERALDAGFCGIGELFPQVQGFAYDDTYFVRVLQIAAERQAPVNLHVTDPLVPTTAVNRSTPLENFIRLAKEFPTAKLILAHWGGGLPFYELNPQLHQILRNVTYDCAASPLLYDKRVFRQVIDLVGVDRVLYGSDYPLLLYPREQREPDFKRFLNEVVTAGLSVEEQDKVLGKNLLRLVGRE
jgi:predicted TIM-barrel fold metal-dependent hydrolase